MTNTLGTGTIQHVAPADLIIEANVRTSAPVTPEFIASIRENGVITPVLARRDEHGNVIVRAGQRRTLAAREAGVATIPVYVVEGDETTADRIVQQIIENDQRAELSTADRTAAWAQLSFEGVSAASIAKRTGTKTATVKKGLAVAESATLTSVLHEHELTLDQAAVLLEFEEDEQTRAQLIKVATTDPAQFVHTAQRARDERARAQVKAAAEAELTARGFAILDSEVYYGDTSHTSIRDLRKEDGSRVDAADIENVEGRAAYVRVVFTGKSADVSYYLSDPRAAGFRKEGGNTAGPMTDEQKAERRILVANNKAWNAAETVRREWIASFLSRKTLPKDADRVIALGLTVHRFSVSSGMTGGNALAHTLLGIAQPSGFHADALGALVEANPAKARLVVLAVVLGGEEANTSKESWRRGDERAAAHFRQLATWGYALSPVEQVVTGDTTAADAAGLS